MKYGVMIGQGPVLFMALVPHRVELFVAVSQLDDSVKCITHDGWNAGG